MKNDIKNNIQLLSYPKINEFTEITEQQLIKYIEDFKPFVDKYNENLDYYISKSYNATKDELEYDNPNPDSRICASYARTQTQIVKGYMYKPNLITYDSEDEAYMERIDYIFEKNDETLVNSELGESQSKYGIGIELLYISSDEEDDLSIPYFNIVNPQDCIIIYNTEIRNKIIGCIRYFIVEKRDNFTKYKCEVYFKDRIEIWYFEKSETKKAYFDSSYANFFKEIPINVYINNNEYHADYEPIKTLIDAYDVLLSDGVNELNRFANSYLILKNFIFSSPDDSNEKRIELEKLKSRRVLEFGGADGGAEFLTRDIPAEFFTLFKSTLREDIEYHSHIPDYRSKNFEAKSGEAQKWALLDFENLCSDKEAWFRVGLNRRLKLINNFLAIKEINSAKVNIEFKRNLPNNIKDQIDIFKILADSQKLADEDLLSILPVELIPDYISALDRLKKQKDENMKMFDLDSSIEDEDDKNDKMQQDKKSITEKSRSDVENG